MPQRSHRATIATVAAAAAAAVVLMFPVAAGAGSVDVREPSLPAPSSSPPSAASSPLADGPRRGGRPAAHLLAGSGVPF